MRRGQEAAPAAREAGDVKASSAAAPAVLAVVAAAAAFAFPLHGMDVAVTRTLQHAAPFPDVPAALFVFLGDAEVAIPALLIAALLLRRHRSARARAAWTLAFGLLIVSAIAFTLKWVLPHPGPPPELQRYVFRPGLGVPQRFSFPSGHTMRATYFAANVLAARPAAACALVLTMMAALVYLGDHWTTDVLGGLCLGWACAAAGRLLMPGQPRSRLRD